MNLQQYQALLLIITGTLALIVASPALQRLLVYPQTEFFTEMWLLGPEYKAENYPYNITLNNGYTVFLGVSNHLGHCAYYVVQVKFRTQNQSAPDARTPSSLPPLYSVNVVVADKEAWELPVTFSFDYSYDASNSQVNFNRMIFNGATLNLNGYSASWDAESSRFFGNLIFELWVYNDAAGGFTYHERYNDLKFNMTV
jgi:uncharacterized membrane protein